MLGQTWLISQAWPALTVVEVVQPEQLRQWVLKAPSSQSQAELRSQL